jgi:EmrB/QacA subfamily drug resistance transporter
LRISAQIATLSDTKPSRIVKEKPVSPTETPYAKRWWTLAVVALSLLVISLDNTILNVALPSIETDLGASAGQLQWIVDSYTLVFAGLLLTAGSLGDRFGRRRALQLGLGVFGLGSLLAALSPDAGTLIASRALMGVGAAFVMPATLSIITNTFPAGERAKAISIWAAVAGLGIAIGPIAGGWLIEHFDWSSVFLVNLPVILVALAGRGVVPESKDPAESKLDPFGAVLSMTGLATLVWGLIEAPSRGWTDGLILGDFALAGALLVAFAVWELRTPSPMLDMRVFKVRAFSGASVAVSLVFFALFGTIFMLTQYLQLVLDYGAFDAGLRTAPIAAGLIVGAGLSHRLVPRFGSRAVVTGGLLTVTTGLLLLSTADAASGYGIVAAAIVFMGLGMGNTMAPATESIMSSLPLAHAGVGSAMNDTTRMVGGTLGVAILGSVLNSSYSGSMESATQGLPAGAAESAGDSIGGATGVAEHIGGSAARVLNQAAESAFTDAMSIALVVAAGVALAGAAVALTVMPSRARQHASPELVPAADPVPA